LKVYLVGGAVRDKLMNKEPKDRDYVVVGAEPQDMIALGFKQVGSSFPVFLHPESKEEYALARTEKKSGVGYQGFDCYFGKDVTLEEDLARRDLTINAIAMCLETDEIVDPFNGADDIKNKTLRPTTNSFCEDPLRVLRAARFLARYPDFKASEELVDLCHKVKDEIQYLPKERIWLETEKGLSENKPSNYFEFLKQFGIFETLDSQFNIPQPIQHHPEGCVWTHIMMCVDHAANAYRDVGVVFGALVHDFGKAYCYNNFKNLHGHEEEGVKFVEDFCKTFKIPNKFKELGLICCKYHTHVHMAFNMKPKSIYKLFENVKAETKTDRFYKFLDVCESDAKGRGDYLSEIPYTQKQFLIECLDAVKSVDTKIISATMLAKGKSGKDIGEAIRVAKIDAIRGVKNKWK